MRIAGMVGGGAAQGMEQGAVAMIMVAMINRTIDSLGDSSSHGL